MRYKKFYSIILAAFMCFQLATMKIFAAEERNPFDWVSASVFDEKKSDTLKTETNIAGDNYILNISSGDWLCFENLNFAALPYFIDLRIGGETGYDGTVEVYLDSLSGEKIASITTENKLYSWGTGVNYRAEINGYDIYGIHSVYFVFSKGGINFHKFRFLTDYEYKNPYEMIYPSQADGITDGNAFGIYKDETFERTVNAAQESVLYFDNVCFTQAPEYAEIFLGNTGECGGTVEIRLDSPDGDLIAAIDTYGGKDEENTSRGYIKPIDFYIYRSHRIYIIWKSEGIDFFGLKFHKTTETLTINQKDAFELINSHSFDGYSGQKIDYGNTKLAANGFMRENVNGNRISYTVKGLTFTYDNVYFKEVPTKLSVLLGYGSGYTGKDVIVKLDGQELSVVTPTEVGGMDWDKGKAHFVDVAGKIEKNSVHSISIELCGSVNYYGMQFFMDEFRNPYSFVDITTYDELKGTNSALGIYDTADGASIQYINNQTYVKYADFSFEDAPLGIEILFGSGAGYPVKAEVRAGGRTDSDSILLETIQENATGDWYKKTSFRYDFSQEITGMHDIYIVFKAPVNFFGFRFYNTDYDKENKNVVLKTSENMKNKLLIIGSYDENGALTGVKKTTVTYTESKNQTVNVSEIINNSSDKIKVFIWSDEETFKPYKEADEYEILY